MKLKCPICSGSVNKKNGICKSCGYIINRYTEGVNHGGKDIQFETEEKSKFEPVKLCANCNCSNKITAIMCKACGESLTNSKIIRNEKEEYVDVNKRIDYGWFDKIFNNRLFSNKIYKIGRIVLICILFLLYIINYARPVIHFEGYNYRKISSTNDNVEEFRNRRIGRDIKIIDKEDYKEIIVSDIGTYKFDKKLEKLTEPDGNETIVKSTVDFRVAQLGVDFEEYAYSDIQLLCQDYGYTGSNGHPWLFVVGIMILVIGLFQLKRPDLVFQIRYFLSVNEAEPSNLFLNMTRIAGLLWSVSAIAIIAFSYGNIFI